MTGLVLQAGHKKSSSRGGSAGRDTGKFELPTPFVHLWTPIEHPEWCWSRGRAGCPWLFVIVFLVWLGLVVLWMACFGYLWQFRVGLGWLRVADSGLGLGWFLWVAVSGFWAGLTVPFTVCTSDAL